MFLLPLSFFCSPSPKNPKKKRRETKVSHQKQKKTTTSTHTPALPQTPATSLTPRRRFLHELNELTRQTNLNWRRSLCEYKNDDAIGAREKANFQNKKRVFLNARNTKTTRCVPYKSENTVSSTIITFLDKTNLRKQTSVHLLWGQATLIVKEKRSTKIDFHIFARRFHKNWF